MREPLDARAAPLAGLLRLNARLVENCVDGFTDALASARPLASVNSVAFLLAHLVDARHSLLAVLGGSATNPMTPYLAHARSIADVETLPPLDALLAAWRDVDAALAEQLAVVPPASLDAPAPWPVPGDDRSVLGALAFLVQHDSYHLGQLALLRRAHGLPAMRYGEPRSDGAPRATRATRATRRAAAIETLRARYLAAARSHARATRAGDLASAAGARRTLASIARDLCGHGAAGEAALRDLIGHAEPAARLWAAGAALAFSPADAERALEEVASGPRGPERLEAEAMLRDWRAGRLPLRGRAR